MKTLLIEAVGKYGVKANNVWYGVEKSKVSLDSFEINGLYEVETQAWNKNGKSGENIISVKKVENTSTTTSTQYVPVNKDKRILWQGVVQAVAGAVLISDVNNIELVKKHATELVKFIEEKAV